MNDPLRGQESHLSVDALANIATASGLEVHVGLESAQVLKTLLIPFMAMERSYVPVLSETYFSITLLSVSQWEQDRPLRMAIAVLLLLL